jgi:hypothetical protein
LRSGALLAIRPLDTDGKFGVLFGAHQIACLNAKWCSMKPLPMSPNGATHVPGPYTRPGDPPWINALIPNYYINLNASAVNGEVLQIDRSDVDGPNFHGTGPPTHPFRQRIMFSTSGPAAFSCHLINSNATAKSSRAPRAGCDVPIGCSRSLLEPSAK